MNKLRIGVMLDSFQGLAWTREMLEKIQNGDYAEVCLVILNEQPTQPAQPPSPPPAQSPGKRNLASFIKDQLPLPIRRRLSITRTHTRQAMADAKRRLRGEALPPQEQDDTSISQYANWMQNEERYLPKSVDRWAFKPKDLSDLFNDVDVLNVHPKRSGFVDRFNEEEVERIREQHLDVLIRLGFRILKGSILQAAKYGVWSLHHGDNFEYRGGPAGFWEVFEGNPVTGSILQILTEDLDNGTVLFRSWSATMPDYVYLSRNPMYWKTMLFIPRKLQELHEVGEEEFFRRCRPYNQDLFFYSKPNYSVPPNKTFGPLLEKHQARFHQRIETLEQNFEHWFLLYDLRDELATSFWRYKPILPPPDRFWADPHAIERDGRYYIFFEEVLYRQKKGHISVMTMEADGTLGSPQVVLEEPWHLSFPFVFEAEGKLYMVPESASKRRIDLYRCEEFPNRWTFEKTLLDNVHAVDTVLHRHDGKWWLFTNIMETEGMSSCDELFLFYSDSIHGPWRPHPYNPIVSDVRRARMAGALFQHNGNLYRPGQDCSENYGYGIRVHQVVRLNEREYEERERSVIEPDWDESIIGVHSITHAGRLTMIDAKRLLPRTADGPGPDPL